MDFVTVDAVYPEGGVKRIRIAVSLRPIAPPPVSRTDSPPEHANADVPGYPMPEGPSTELGPQVVPRAKPRVRHAEAQARTSERHGRKTPRTTGKAPVAAHPEAKPGRTKDNADADLMASIVEKPRMQMILGPVFINSQGQLRLGLPPAAPPVAVPALLPVPVAGDEPDFIIEPDFIMEPLFVIEPDFMA